MHNQPCFVLNCVAQSCECIFAKNNWRLFVNVKDIYDIYVISFFISLDFAVAFCIASFILGVLSSWLPFVCMQIDKYLNE